MTNTTCQVAEREATSHGARFPVALRHLAPPPPRKDPHDRRDEPTDMNGVIRARMNARSGRITSTTTNAQINRALLGEPSTDDDDDEPPAAA